MKLILKTRVEGLGDRGAVVRVKNGYARNYLLPKGLAVPATDAHMRAFEEENRLQEIRDNKIKRNLLGVAEKMKGLSCTIVVQAGEDDKLYGSVGTHDIAESVAKQGFDVDHRMVKLSEPIKNLGVYTVQVHLHREIEVPIKVWVVKE